MSNQRKADYQSFFELMEKLKGQRRDMAEHSQNISELAEGFQASPEAEQLDLEYSRDFGVPVTHFKERLREPFSDYYKREFDVPKGRLPASEDLIKDMIDRRAQDKWDKYQEDYRKAEEIAETYEPTRPPSELQRPEVYSEEEVNYAPLKERLKGYKKTGRNVYEMAPLDILAEHSKTPFPPSIPRGLGESLIPPMPELPVKEPKPKKAKLAKKKPWFEVTGSRYESLFNAGKDFSGIIPPAHDIGGSIGAGLAALGDAFMAGGGMKSSFLNNIIKTREKRRAEPMEDFKIFQTLLQKEMAERGRREDRRLDRLRDNLKFAEMMSYRQMTAAQKAKNDEAIRELKRLIFEHTKKKTKSELSLKERGVEAQERLADSAIAGRQSTINKTLPGSPQVQELVRAIKGGAGVGTYRKSFLQDIITGKRPPNSISMKDFDQNTLLQIKPNSRNEERMKKEEAVKKIYNNPIDRAIIKTQFGRPLEDIPGASFNTPNFRQKYSNDKKAVNNLINEKDLKKGTGYARNLLNSVRNIFGMIGMLEGEAVVSMEQFFPDVASNALWFSPRDKKTGKIDHSQKRKIDLPGVTIPIIGRLTQPSDYLAFAKSRFGGYDPYQGMGGLLQQAYSQIHGPKRHEQFGATQTFYETKDWMRQTGENTTAPTNEVVMVKYFWDQGQKLQKDLERHEARIRVLGGQDLVDHFKESGIHIGGNLNDPIVAKNHELADWGHRKYQEALSKVGAKEITSGDMPVWWQENRKSVLESDEAAVPEEKIYYSKTTGRFEKNPYDRSPELGWQPPKNWGFRTWNKYIRNFGLKKR